jgi:hypothetical protein
MLKISVKSLLEIDLLLLQKYKFEDYDKDKDNVENSVIY